MRLLGLLLAATATTASANGRPPATSSIQFRVDHEADVLLGMTFGVVLSHDAGGTWQWMCEAAVGYGGTYDPHFLWFSSGAIFATTFKGLRVSRDGCTFAPIPGLGTKFVSAIARGPDNTLYAAMSAPDDNRIYKSSDEGTTFSQATSLGLDQTFWYTIVVAPSDPSRVYLSGRRLAVDAPGEQELFRSVDGGRAFTRLKTTSFTPVSGSSTLEVIAISPLDPELVFVRVTNQAGDAIYRSADGGQSFTQVLGFGDSIVAFVWRKNGDLVAAAAKLGLYRSSDGGRSFHPLATSPALHPRCLVETSAGELWACAENYASENMGVARSTDGATWTKVFRYQELAQPVACVTGSVQMDTCAKDWCAVRAQLGVIANPTDCPLGSGSAKREVPRPKLTAKGCCEAGNGSGALVPVLLAGAALFRRRKLHC